jgi:hypothetical protein
VKLFREIAQVAGRICRYRPMARPRTLNWGGSSWLPRGRRAVMAEVTVLTVVLVIAALVYGMVASRSSGPPPSTVPVQPASGAAIPTLGVLGVSGNYYKTEASAGIDAVTLVVTWDQAQPTKGSLNASYMAQIQARITAARTAGLKVILDPGLHFPPEWVFALPGGTRFVNQYGNVFTGPEADGNDVANAVTNGNVRAAEGTYLSLLGAQIKAGSIIAIRQGGGPLGELRYPKGSYDGHTNSYWAYDASTQAALPSSVRGWTPGTGTTAQAQAFLDAYNGMLDTYGIWLNGQLHTDFNTTELVMLPGWGERPGGGAGEVASRLTQHKDEFNEGLDWANLLPRLPDASHSVAYTTYLDAQTVLPTIPLEDPSDYLAYLVAGTPIKLGGENTGNGNYAAMQACLSRARSLGFVMVNWQNEGQLVASTRAQNPTGPTFNQLVAAAKS